MVWETHKIMGDESIRVNPTAVRVPVFYGHAEAIHLELRQPVSAEDVKELLRDAPGVQLMDEDKEFPTQVSHASGQDLTFVGRVREDLSHPHGINLWVVADNVRKGAATNSIQIAELLIKEYLWFISKLNQASQKRGFFILSIMELQFLDVFNWYKLCFTFLKCLNNP